jgi:hypothetical protein
MALVKQGVRTVLQPAISRLGTLIRNSVPKADVESASQEMQRSIVTQYALCRVHKIVPYQAIRDSGFRVYSQFEEDGIILYLLSMIGFKTRRVVEICAGNGEECMATNLILNHGFEGFLFDGDLSNVEHAQEFFRNKKDCLLQYPIVKQAWITAEDINATLEQAGCAGEVDFLSLDIDGNEFWVWKAIRIIRPRLIVVETHNVIPSDKSITIPYRPDFDYHKGPAEDFRSVSLLAMVRLCRQRGYRLIGAHRHGFNAFFLRNDEGVQFFPEVSVESVHDNPYTRWSQATRWPPIKDLAWIEIPELPPGETI